MKQSNRFTWHKMTIGMYEFLMSKYTRNVPHSQTRDVLRYIGIYLVCYYQVKL